MPVRVAKGVGSCPGVSRTLTWVSTLAALRSPSTLNCTCEESRQAQIELDKRGMTRTYNYMYTLPEYYVLIRVILYDDNDKIRSQHEHNRG